MMVSHSYDIHRACLQILPPERYDPMIEAKKPVISLPRTRETEEAATPVIDSLSPQEGTAPIEILIRPQTGWIPIDWKELYAYRELLFFFVWRDISARYKQTVLGSAWAVIQPLLMMVNLHLHLQVRGYSYPFAQR